jgi:hypothetical protein
MNYTTQEYIPQKYHKTSVGWVIQYNDQNMGWTTGVRFSAGEGIFPLRHRVQTESGTHLTFYPVGTGSYFPDGKAAGG